MILPLDHDQPRDRWNAKARRHLDSLEHLAGWIARRIERREAQGLPVDGERQWVNAIEWALETLDPEEREPGG